MGDSDIAIKRCILISGGSCKLQPWCLTSVETVQGCEFVRLSKSDNGFARFVAGSGKGIRHMVYLSTIRQLRTEATLRCLSEGSLFDSIPTKAAKSHHKRRCVEAQSRGELPQVVDVEMPPIATHGVPAMTMRMLSCIDINAAPSIELTPDNLHYVRMGMLSSTAEVRSQSVSKGVRWDSKRKAYIAKRNDAEGKVKYKTFRPDDVEDEVDCASAQEHATRWADGDDVGDNNDSEESQEQLPESGERD